MGAVEGVWEGVPPVALVVLLGIPSVSRSSQPCDQQLLVRKDAKTTSVGRKGGAATTTSRVGCRKGNELHTENHLQGRRFKGGEGEGGIFR